MADPKDITFLRPAPQPDPTGDKLAAIRPVLDRVRRSDHWYVAPGKSPCRTNAPLNDEAMRRHFSGIQKIGACPMERGSSTTRIALFDLDSHKGETDWPKMAEVARKLIATGAERGIRFTPFRSSGGHGIHLICIFDEPQDARSVRAAMSDILAAHGLSNGTRGVAAGTVEIFPKSDAIPADGHGSMFILPLAGKSVALDPEMLEPIGIDAIQWPTSNAVPYVAPPPPIERTEYDAPALARVQSALDALDPADFGYGGEKGEIGFIDLLFATHDATGGSAEGLEMFLAWCSRWPGYDADASHEHTVKNWNAAKPGKGIGAGTLFRAARAAGWVDPVHAPNAEGFENLNAAAAQRLHVAYVVGDLTPEEIATASPDVLAELAQIDAAIADSVREAQTATQAAIERAKAPKFTVVPAEEFAARSGARWRIKGVLPDAGVAMIYGAPASGKSFFALDVCASIARGINWRGRRTTKGRVAYVAAEGRAGFAVRMRAYLQQNALEGLPGFGIIAETPNFFASSTDHVEILAAVTAWGGADVIVIDTLAASSAGADENTAKEQGAVLGKLIKLQAATGGLVILVHHAGKDESKGARGWSGMKAAMDAEIEVSRPDEEQPGRVARVTKQKDGESGQVFGFELVGVELGRDEDGDPITSCVVNPTDEVPAKRARQRITAERRPRGQYQQVAYDMVLEAGGPVEVEVLLDAMVEKMTMNDEALGAEGVKRDQRRKNAKRDLGRLIDARMLEPAPGQRLRLYGMGDAF